MSVIWSATSPALGTYSPVETDSDFAEMSERFSELRAQGQGYLEVAHSDSDFPLLTLGFQDGRAVIHVFDGPDEVALLAGDGAVASDATVTVLIMDDLSEFTGDVVMSLERAWDVVSNFVRTGTTADLGDRFEL
jgi:hypothetical protein